VLPADVERIIWFDCDIYQTRPLHLAEIPDVPFAAALDTKWCDEKTREDWPEAESVVEFFNSGVMVCRRETRDIFEKVKVISERLIAGEEVPGNMGDQRWFNKYVAEKYKDFGTNPTGWHALPMEWNVINGRDRPLRPIFVHFAGIWDRWTLLDLLYKAADEAERFVVRR
jgi:lipopolysaccharide biosynthesis glycosyltransferase